MITQQLGGVGIEEHQPVTGTALRGRLPHSLGVDWLASGPPASTGQAALANFEAGLDLSSRQVWGDPDDPGEPSYEVPQHTLELAHELVHDWGLDATAPGFPDPGGWQDVLRPPAAPVTVADALYEGIGLGVPEQRPGYPGISELAEQLGLK